MAQRARASTCGTGSPKWAPAGLEPSHLYYALLLLAVAPLLFPKLLIG